MEKLKKQKAFTLIEILVATSIIVFMSAVIFANYNSENKQLALLRSSAKLAQDLRKAAEMSISAAQINGTFPQGGYGIYFDSATPNQYILFADSYITGSALHTYDAGQDLIVQTIQLEGGISLNSFSPYGKIAVTFVPPDPLVTIKNNETSATTTSATVGLLGGNFQKSINVNSTGLINVGQSVAITCSSNNDCEDSNPCTQDACLNPGTISSSCQHSNLPNDTSCGGGRTCQDTFGPVSICSECVSALNCGTLYGISCDYGTCPLDKKPNWSCSMGSCSYSCIDDPTCLTNQPLGANCTLDQQCASGNCSWDGFCCNLACEGECQTCSGGSCQTRLADDNSTCTNCKRCDGINTTCQFVAFGQEGKNCVDSCKQCSGGDACLNITNAEDTVGVNQWSGACKYCSAGSPVTKICEQENYGLSCTSTDVCNGSANCVAKSINGSTCNLGGTCSACSPLSNCLFCSTNWCGSTGLCGPPNETPTISLIPDSPDPVKFGNTITFSANWSDPNPGDQVKIHICKNTVISGQSCTGGSWCDSASFSGTSPASCNYTAQASDVGMKNYYAFICDDENTCSSPYQAGTFTVSGVEFISYSQSLDAVSSQNCAITKPSGLTVGDLMIAHVMFRTSGVTNTLSGWTKFEDRTSTDVRSAIFWKIATASDVSAANFTFTNAVSAPNIGTISIFRGHNPAAPILASNGQGNSSQTITSPGITPSAGAGQMLLFFTSTSDDNTAAGYSISTNNPVWTEQYDIQTNPSGGSNEAAISMATGPRTQTTATGNGTATSQAADPNVGHLVGIAPAP